MQQVSENCGAINNAESPDSATKTAIRMKFLEQGTNSNNKRRRVRLVYC
jgi:hypothetical protein